MAATVALGGLAYSTSSRSSETQRLATAGPIEGGWSFTAYSNKEPFARAMVNAFGRHMRAAKMDDLGVYPGNADETMIERWNDSNYIETCNFAYIQCHGNPYSISLNYEPTIAGLSQYRFGDDGRLQWIAVGGCDILGYSRLPDGSPAPSSYWYPALSRWNDAFQGISGLLGYRSASFYRVNDTHIPAMAAAVLVRELQAGHTFYEAWLAAANYVHSVLNQRAEAAVFASSSQALGDTLINFHEERPRGLDVASVRRAIVGRGPPPVYDYEEVVDGPMQPASRRIAKPSRMPKSKVLIRAAITVDFVALPVLEVTPVALADAIAARKSVDPKPVYSVDLGGGRRFDAVQIGSTTSLSEITSLLPASQLLADANGKAVGTLSYQGVAAPNPDGGSRTAFAASVSVGSKAFPVLDYGVTIDSLAAMKMVRVSGVWQAKTNVVRSVSAPSQGQLRSAVELAAADFETATIDSTFIAYSVFSEFNTEMRPVVALNCTFVRGSVRAHAQILVEGNPNEARY